MVQNTDKQLVITDLSPHAVQLARAIDRLTPGVYEITIDKGEIRQEDWTYQIMRKEMISKGNLSSKKYQTEQSDEQ